VRYFSRLYNCTQLLVKVQAFFISIYIFVIFFTKCFYQSTIFVILTKTHEKKSGKPFMYVVQFIISYTETRMIMRLSQNNLYDMHMHCHFSGDSEATPSDMAQKAVDIGLQGICFTDHLDIDYKETPGLFDLDISSYKKEISSVKKAFAGKLNIGWGIELGLQPYLAQKNNTIIKENDFDYVIGSTHVVKQTDIYFPAYYEGRTEVECYQEYFEETLRNAQSDVTFDVYGHLDYIVRYGPNKNQFYSYEKYADVIDEILRTLIQKGKGIELNTAGFKYGLGHAHPTMDTLKRYKALGGEIITIGSDGHAPEQIAWDFDKVPEILKEAGFNYFTIFKNRKEEFIKL